MFKTTIHKIKFYCLIKLTNRVVNYFVLLLRSDLENQIKYNERSDIHLRHIALGYLFPKLIGLDDDYKIDNEFLDELKAKVEVKTEGYINEIKKKHHAYFDVFDLTDEEIEDDLEFIEIRDLESVKQKTQQIDLKSLILLVRKFQRKNNKLQKQFSEKNAIKVFFKYEHFTKGLAIITPILLTGGVFRQFIISIDFSFPLPMVFSFSDYISASIDTLIFAVFPTIILIISYYIGYHEGSRTDRIGNANDKKGDLFQYLLYTFIFALTIYSYFTNQLNFYKYLPLAGLFLMMLVLIKLINRYLKADYNVIIIIFSIIFFYLNIFSSTKSDSYLIKSDKSEKRIKIEFSEDTKNLEHLKYVTSGTNYYVFWDSKSQSTVLMKPDKINRIIIK